MITIMTMTTIGDNGDIDNNNENNSSVPGNVQVETTGNVLHSVQCSNEQKVLYFEFQTNDERRARLWAWYKLFHSWNTIANHDHVTKSQW